MKITETLTSLSFRSNWIIMIIFLGLDLGSKIWVRANIPLYETTGILTNFLDLTHVQNRGVSLVFWRIIPIRLEFLCWLVFHCWQWQQCFITRPASGTNWIFTHVQVWLVFYPELQET